MRRYFILFFLFCFSVVVKAQLNGADVLVVKETYYDFGKIPQGKPVTHFFEVVNSGNLPLHLEDVQASCGCTTPEWQHEPIPPGGVQKIKVGYNAATKGRFDKTITIYYNSGKTKQLHIKGEVWELPATLAPTNASIELLKNINH